MNNANVHAITFDDLFQLFSTEITNTLTAKGSLGIGKTWNPSLDQSRWLYFAFRFLIANRATLDGVDIKKAARILLDVVCKGQIRARAVDLTNELNFGREVLRIIGYRTDSLVARLAAPARSDELTRLFARDVVAPVEVRLLDESLLRTSLETDLIALMRAHDPGRFESFQLARDPIEAAKVVNRFAKNFFRPYIAAIKDLPVTIGSPLTERVTLIGADFSDGLRAGLLINRAQQLPVLTRANYNSTRERDKAVVAEIVLEALKKKDVQELVDRHLRVTPRAGHAQKKIHMQSHYQRFAEHTPEQAAAEAQWQRIGSISHELMHFYCHHNFESKSAHVPFGQVITEGFTELLGQELLEGLRQAVARRDAELTRRLRGEAPEAEFVQVSRELLAPRGYEEAVLRARAIQTKVGQNNVRAAYFLGRPELIGLA